MTAVNTIKQGYVLEDVLLGGEDMGANLDLLISNSSHEDATPKLRLK